MWSSTQSSCIDWRNLRLYNIVEWYLFTYIYYLKYIVKGMCLIMKRIVSMILSLSFVFSGTLAFSAEEEKEIPDYALSLNFDSDKPGGEPSGFDYLSVKNKDEITIADVPDNGNKSVKIQSFFQYSD